ncbi:MAG: hypothetical protein GWP05_11120 [Anaerolineaceae bacterium]|nr:hypothetical protein [Anaerolineaceae bacterium]
MKVILRILLAIALLVAASPGAWAQEAADLMGGNIGGLRLNGQEAAVSVAVVRHVLKTLEADKSLARQPSRKALILTIGRRLFTAWPLKAAPPRVLSQERHMQVFVTLYGPRGADLTAEGRGNTLLAALIDASTNLPRDMRYRGDGFNKLNEIRISLEVTVYRLPYMQNLAEPFLYSMRPGLDGLVYQNADQRSTVLPWEAIRRGWEMHFTRRAATETKEARPAYLPDDVKKAVFRSLLDRAGADTATWRGPGARVLRFETQCFIERRPGGPADGDPASRAVVAIYRTGPLVDYEELTRARVASAVSLATNYLARTLVGEQQVRAGYDPLRDRWQAEFDAPRQALAVRAFARLYGRRKEQWMLKAAQSACSELLKPIKQVVVVDAGGARRPCAFVVSGLKSQITWTAQALLAVADLQAVAEDKAVATALRRLANTLLVEDGAFDTYFVPGTSEQLGLANSEDLDGESLALLALARSYELLKDESLLASARRSADYLVFQRERRLGRKQARGLADIHLIEALALLDRHLANDAYARYAGLCADAILEDQASQPARYLDDEVGGWATGNHFQSELASFNLRGLVAARRMAEWVGKLAPERFRRLKLDSLAERTARGVRMAEAFLVNLQYTPTNSFYVTQPQIASGGLRFSATDSRISTVAVCNFLLAEVR